MDSDFATAFTIGPISVSWYSILFTLGFLAFIVFSYYEWRKKKYDKFDFFILIGFGVIIALLGARIWYLIFNPSDFQNFVSLFSVSSGRSILGSIFFVYLWIFYYTKFHASYIETRFALSIFLPNILLGQAIGRWGNFFQQDVYGKAANDLAILPEFIREHMIIDGEYRQPLFLYESILDLLGWIIIISILKQSKKIKPGVHAGFYIFWYGMIRAILELFRDDTFIMHIGNVPTSFVLALIFMFAGLFIMYYYQFLFVKKEIWMKFNYEQKKKQIFNNLNNFWRLSLFKLNLNNFLLNIKNNKKKYNIYVKNLNQNKIERFKKTIVTKY